MSLNRNKRYGNHLNVIYIIEFLLFSVINIFVFKYYLSADIFNDVLVYSTKCGSVVETASTYVCYSSILDYNLGRYQSA